MTSTGPCPPQVIQQTLNSGLASMIEVYGSSETAGIGWRERSDDSFRLFTHWRRHGEEELVSPDGRTLALPDLVQWQSDRTLRPLQRRDHAVQVGGTNVWPERVKSFIESHHAVQGCAVRPMETPNGTRLKALIVPERAMDNAARAELRTWLRRQLPAAERPINLTFGEALPRNELGKLSDW